MLTKQMQRFLSLVMVLVMALSLMPFHAFATETEESGTITEEAAEAQGAADSEGETESLAATSPVTEATEATATTAANEPDPLEDLQARMDDILIRYLGKTVMTEDEVIDIVVNMPWDTIQAALTELEELRSAQNALTDEERILLQDEYGGYETICYFYEILKKSTTPSTFALNNTHTINGVEVIIEETTTDGYADSSDDGSSITVMALSDAGSFQGAITAAVVTITMYNPLDTDAILTFHWEASSEEPVYQLTLPDGSIATTQSGDCQVTLTAGGSCVTTINTGTENDNINTVIFSNIAVAEKGNNYNVTFSYDDTLGSISVGGTAVDSGTVSELPVDGTGVALKATTKNGGTFVGWTYADGTLLSTDTEYSFVPSADATVVAKFIDTSKTAVFRVGNALYDTLTTANTAAVNGSSKVITPVVDSTLPAGDYTISNGVTLLVPFDTSNTLYTTEPANVTTAWKTPTFYRTLTMAQNAKITVQSGGAISLSAKHYAGSAGTNAGSPIGEVSRIIMNSGSSITVNSDANLYAWGFITGSGNITINSGGSVYENFQINDFRGGTHTSWVISNQSNKAKKVFPINSYYIQNIEVPMKLEAGATETGYCSINASGATSTAVTFIASSGAMFNLTSGYLIKDYVESKDRLQIEIQGNMNIAPLSLTLGDYNINSEQFNLPINSNISVDIKSGNIEVNQDLALLPGAEIVIGTDVTFTIKSGKKVFVYDSAQWSAKYLYPTSAKFRPAAYAPGNTYKKADHAENDASICVNGTLDATAGAIYTTSSGANIYSTANGIVKLSAGGDTQTHQITGLASIKYTTIFGQKIPSGINDATAEAISITLAKLVNGDGSYVTTEAAAYYYGHGVWLKNQQHTETETVTAPTCTEQGYTHNVCVCGYEYDDAQVPATDHKWDAGVQTTAPGCETEGVKTFTCQNNSGHTKTEPIPAIGHKYGEGVVTVPTCTETGYTTYTCINGNGCTHSYTDTEVAALGHKYTWTITTAAKLDAMPIETGTCTNTNAGTPCTATTTRQVIQSAQIGETKYDTLQEALAAVESPTNLQTVTLLTNFTTDEIPVSQLVTIDKGSYTATITAGAGYRIADTTDTSVTIRKNPEVVATNIAVNEGLDLYFYVPAADIGNDKSDYVAVVTKSFADDREENPVEKSYASGSWEPYPSTDNLKYYRFGFDDISAKEMTDNVTVVIKHTDNTYTSNTYEQTIQNYVIQTLENYEKQGDNTQKTEYLRNALVDMLVYGTAAQEMFEYNESVPAWNPDGFETLKSYEGYITNYQLLESENQKIWDRVAGVTISARNKLLYTFYFSVADPTGMYAQVVYTHHNDPTPTTYTVYAEDFYKRNEGLYGVDVPKLSIVDGFQLLKCTLYDENGTVIGSGQDSIAGYAYRNQGSADIYLSMMRFVKSAQNYFYYEESAT